MLVEIRELDLYKDFVIAPEEEFYDRNARKQFEINFPIELGFLIRYLLDY